MHTSTETPSVAGTSGDLTTVKNRIQETADDAMDLARYNPVVTIVAVGVVGFALGALVGRSSVRQRSALDANLDSLHRAAAVARSGTVNTVGNLRRVLRDEGFSTDQIQGSVKQQMRRLIAAARNWNS
jgi:hypothetical protein